MGHISILIMSVVLLLGLTSAFYTYLIYRNYNALYLKRLAQFILFYNSTILIFIVLSYIGINLLGQKSFYFSSALMTAAYIAGFILMIFMGYFFAEFTFRLISDNFRDIFIRIYVSLISFFAFGYIFGIINFLDEGDITWLENSYIGMSSFSVLVIYFSCFYMFHAALKHKDKSEKRSLVFIGSAYSLFYTLYFLSMLLPERNMVYVESVVIALINIIPVIWIKKFFIQSNSANYIVEDKSLLFVLIQRYRISERELDIIDLILKGKSNKEIEEELFISFNTVKNHIYNIYRKIGVNSRGQLVYRITEEQNHKNRAE
ncbi:LuxR C-terminal-related transcriptional regulator [candidate division KSB1 bacterium]